MTGRFPRLAATLVLGSLTLAGCGSDDTSPVEASTVRLAVVPGAHHGGAPYATELTTETWHTPRDYTGDPDGTGSALITINLGQEEVCWHLTVSDIEPATSAHIHQALTGVQGPIYVPLTPPDANGEVSGCRSEPRAKLKLIMQFPDSFYVNVHNSGFPSGAVRGQLD
jgi:hypothetical protein